MPTVYVVTAIENDRVVEQSVYSTMAVADIVFKRMIAAYGGARICLASRDLRDAAPALNKNPSFEEKPRMSYEWAPPADKSSYR